MSKEFIPVLRFSVCSDLHIGGPDYFGKEKLRKLFHICGKIVVEAPVYKRMDAYIFDGDSTNDGTKEQYNAFWTEVVHAGVLDRTYHIVAKNHDNWEFGNSCVKTGLAYSRQIFGKDTDFHVVLNGFHFIGISTCDEDGVYYSEKQLQWLDGCLQEAVAQNPERPVFVFQHEHVKNTVYGSFEEDGWGMDFFTDVLRKYPQVVHFSGHSHYPLNDPRSVVQKDFTAVGTGAMSYAEFTVDGERKIHPDNHLLMAQGWIVEADVQGNLLLHGMDYYSETELCRIELPAPMSKAAFTRTNDKLEAKAEAPVFPEDAAVSVQTVGDKWKVAFSTAIGSPENPVFLYRINVCNDQGQILWQTSLLHPYWYRSVKRQMSVMIPSQNGPCVIQIEAENAFGRKSRTIQAEVIGHETA